MAEILEFRAAKLTFGQDNVTLVVQARIEESWETVEFPVYLDQPTVRTLPGLKRITAVVRRRFQTDSPLHAALDGSALTLKFESGGELHQFSQARVIEWKVFGELGGEMMEEVKLACEEEG